MPRSHLRNSGHHAVFRVLAVPRVGDIEVRRDPTANRHQERSAVQVRFGLA